MVRPLTVPPRGSRSLALAAALLLAVGLSWARQGAAESQSFHLVEINKIMVGYNGNMNLQAVELKMILGAENLVSGTSIAVYDSIGGLRSTLGSFLNNVTNAVAGDRILCATAGFRDAFGITPDLLITPGLLTATGQVAFEKPTCRINTVAYGNVPLPLTGTTSASPLLPHGATALVRITDNGTVPSCPQSESSATKFQLRGAGSSNPFVFQNNARDTAQVWTSVTSVEDDPAPPVTATLRASPNPFTASTTIRLPGGAGRVSLYDVSGRLVRAWEPSSSGAASGVIRWDGRDGQGSPQPSGLYFIETVAGRSTVRGRVLLLR